MSVSGLLFAKDLYKTKLIFIQKWQENALYNIEGKHLTVR